MTFWVLESNGLIQPGASQLLEDYPERPFIIESIHVPYQFRDLIFVSLRIGDVVKTRGYECPLSDLVGMRGLGIGYFQPGARLQIEIKNPRREATTCRLILLMTPTEIPKPEESKRCRCFIDPNCFKHLV